MTGLWDAERDAYEAAQALAALAALLRAVNESAGDPAERRMLASLAQNGETAAQRVVAYLRDQRGAGDGDLASVPSRLAPWRDWVPSRGHLFAATTTPTRTNEVPQPRRCDPGE